MDRWTARQLVSASLKMGLKRGEPKAKDGICFVPLLSDETAEPTYSTLKAALRRGEVEVQEGLGMNELLLENKSGGAVLVMQGQELLGRSQHRQVNVSLMAPVGQTKIPVTCLQELKGLNYGSAFYEGGFTYPAIRSHTIASTSQSLWSANGWHADQLEVWRRVSDFYDMSCLDRASYMRYRGAFHTVSEAVRRQERFQHLVNEFACLPGQCGVIVIVGEEVVAMEYTGSPATWSEVHNDTVSSYISEALLTGSSNPVNQANIDSLLTKFAVLLESMKVSLHRGLGLGFNVRMKVGRYVGESLIHQGRILHCILVKAPTAKITTREEELMSRDWARG